MSEYDHQQLDELIHSRLRLAVMSLLAGVERADFSFLKAQVNATDGNLGSHLRRLEEAGYVSVEKRFEGRRPLSEYALTESGRAALDAYLQALEALLPRRA